VRNGLRSASSWLLREKNGRLRFGVWSVECGVWSVGSNLVAAAAKFDAGLITLQQQQQGWRYGIGIGEVVKVFSHHQHGSRGGLVTPPSPRRLSVDSGSPRRRRKRPCSVRGRSSSKGAVAVVAAGDDSTQSKVERKASIVRRHTPFSRMPPIYTLTSR